MSLFIDPELPPGSNDACPYKQLKRVMSVSGISILIGLRQNVKYFGILFCYFAFFSFRAERLMEQTKKFLKIIIMIQLLKVSHVFFWWWWWFNLAESCDSHVAMFSFFLFPPEIESMVNRQTHSYQFVESVVSDKAFRLTQESTR